MRPRHAVLLTPSILLRYVPLPHYLPKSFPCPRSENSPVSLAVATLPKTRVSNPCVCHTSEPPGGALPLSPPLATHQPRLESSSFLSYSSALFCTSQKLNPFVFNRFRTLCQKPPGAGEGHIDWSAPCLRPGRSL